MPGIYAYTLVFKNELQEKYLYKQFIIRVFLFDYKF